MILKFNNLSIGVDQMAGQLRLSKRQQAYIQEIKNYMLEPQR